MKSELVSGISALCFSLVFLTFDIKINTMTAVFWGALIMVGIGGSFYVAKNKGSLTSRNELKAAEWIRNNLPDDVIVATQESNDVMLEYFARKEWRPIKEFVPGDYVLYSLDKFKGMRNERSYWCDRNYCDFDISSLANDYQLIYSNDSVLIWKTKN